LDRKRYNMKKVIIALFIITSFSWYTVNAEEITEPQGNGVVTEENEDITTIEAVAKIKVIMDRVNSTYVGERKDEITNEELMQAALDGIFGKLDNYSEYYTKERYDEYQQKMDGKFGGIGVYINYKENRVRVVRPIKGTPAFEAGLQKGDVFISVNGENITDKTLDEVVNMVRGEEGTTVTIGIQRGTEEFEVEIERKIVEVLSVETKDIKEVLPEIEDEKIEEIAYLQIINFNANVYNQYVKEMQKAKKDGKRGLIIDVRDNPGGYLNEVVNMLRVTIPKGPILFTVDKAGNERTYSGSLEEVPFEIVVITNSDSASASEIFASAIKESGAGKTVGETTFGKGVVQELKRFATGDAFKITIEEYLTRDKNHINGVGVLPDYKVEVPTVKIYGNRRLRLNDTLEDVKRLEKILHFLGYDIKTIDDKYEKETHDAIYKFQEENGLYPYGVADFTTIAKINEAVTEKIKEKDIQLEKAIEVMNEMLK